MRNAVVIDQADIKKILAEKYGVKESDVIKSQYSYTIIMPTGKQENEQ